MCRPTHHSRLWPEDGGSTSLSAYKSTRCHNTEAHYVTTITSKQATLTRHAHIKFLSNTDLRTSWRSKGFSTSHFSFIIRQTMKIVVFFFINTSHIFAPSNILPRRHFHIVLYIVLREQYVSRLKIMTGWPTSTSNSSSRTNYILNGNNRISSLTHCS
jgi:hypothetical protein